MMYGRPPSTRPRAGGCLCPRHQFASDPGLAGRGPRGSAHRTLAVDTANERARTTNLERHGEGTSRTARDDTLSRHPGAGLALRDFLAAEVESGSLSRSLSSATAWAARWRLHSVSGSPTAARTGPRAESRDCSLGFRRPDPRQRRLRSVLRPAPGGDRRTASTTRSTWFPLLANGPAGEDPRPLQTDAQATVRHPGCRLRSRRLDCRPPLPTTARERTADQRPHLDGVDSYLAQVGCQHTCGYYRGLELVTWNQESRSFVQHIKPISTDCREFNPTRGVTAAPTGGAMRRKLLPDSGALPAPPC